MKTRAITAFFFTIVMLGSIFLGGYTFTAFYLVLSIASLLEFFKLIKISGIRPHRNIAVGVAVLCFWLTAGYHYLQFETKYMLLIVPLIFSVFISELYKKDKIPFANISYAIYTASYMWLCLFVSFYSLGFILDTYSCNFHLPLSFLHDALGKRYRRLSVWIQIWKDQAVWTPFSKKNHGKAFLGGMLTSVLVAYFTSRYFTEIGFVVWAGMAILIVCFGTLGDLVESMQKRKLGC